MLVKLNIFLNLVTLLTNSNLLFYEKNYFINNRNYNDFDLRSTIGLYLHPWR
jgi:hypothetical protein